ncbi:hypothetical protein [Parachryseolinea silvisoli]|uniref:hypothetical protein n=1 Tax=Parachryseolinea silvisoli TaxID=2873601 RepID=UPI002265F809|nr:hypothetical protein [Parachryseolinea silvisoli]MCD9017692.1 hypothetical protein [Parachryseolinea silvisoli]
MPTDYPDDSAKYWTMVNGPDGKAIDAKPISSGDTVEFITEEKKVPTGIQFTFLSVDTSDVYQDFYHLETYQQITPGSEFILTPFEINERKYSRQGTFRIVVNDINPPRSHHLTSKYGGMSGGSTWEKYQLRVNSDLGYPDIPHLLTIEDDGGHFFYKFFDGIKDGSDITIASTDLTEVDRYVDVSLPQSAYSSMQVYAYEDFPTEEYNSYMIAGTFSGYYAQRSRQIPFLTRFPFYSTMVEAHFNEENYENHIRYLYQKFGSIPTETIVLSDDMKVTLTNRSVVNYSTSPESTYLMRQTGFYYFDEDAPRMPSVAWQINSPQGKNRISEFPKAVTDRYPALDIGKFQHGRSLFFKKGRNYDDLINETLKGEPRQTRPYEFYFTEIIN